MNSAAPHKSDDIISKYILNIKGFKLLDTKNAKFEWLIPNFISKKSLNMIYACAGSGKAMFVLYLCDYLIKNSDKFDEILYFDADNGIDTLQNRQADKIVRNSKNRLKYILSNSLNRFNLFKNINKKSKFDELKNKLIIIDSIRNFIKGSLSKDENITKFMADLQGIRDKGATIIFLHRQPKQGIEKNDENYKGATAFMDSVDEAYYLQNESESAILADNEIILSLKPKKRRSHTKEAIVLIDTKNLNLNFIEDATFGLSEKEKVSLEFAKEIIDQKSGISQSELATAIQKLANKNYLENVGHNVLWRLFNKFDGKLFEIVRPKGSGSYNKKIFKKL